MFKWLKSKKNDDGAYDGQHVFVQCPACDGYHCAPQIAAYDDAIVQACCDVGESTDMLYETFDVGAPDGRWDMERDAGIFWFTRADGRRCYANFSLVGSWIEASHSWKWGWDLPETHVTPATRRASDCARKIGEANAWPVLTRPYLLLNEDKAWHLTKFAAAAAGHPMVYRAKVNDKAWAYFAIDAPVWET